MKAVKFFSKFFVVIFLIAFAILVLLMMLIWIAKSMVTEESISKYIVSSDIFNCSSSEVLGESNNTTLKQSISGRLLEMEISEEVTEKVLYSNELNEVLTNYVYGYVNNVLFNADRKKFDSDKIINVVQNKYYEAEGSNLSDKQLSELSDYVSDLSMKLYNFTPDISELEDLGINVTALRIASNICYFEYIWFILGTFVLGAYTLIAICLWNKLKAFKWCSNMLIIDGVALVIFSFLEVKFLGMYVNSRGIIDSLVLTITNKSFENLLFYGIALMIVGIILLIICDVLLKKESKENSDNLLNSVIVEEVSAKKSLENHRVRNDEELEQTLNNLNKLEIEKILLDEDPDEKATDEIVVDKDNEIPKVVINGEDFEKSDVDSINSNENIFDKKDDEGDLVSKELETDKNVVDREDDVSSEKDLDNIEFVEVSEDKNDDTLEKEEEIKEFEILDSEQEDVEESPEVVLDKVEYEELEDEDIGEIVKKDVKVFPIEEVKLDVVSPKKGKDVKFSIENLDNRNNDDEEEIEIL